MKRRTVLKLAAAGTTLATAKRFADDYSYKFVPPRLQAQLFSIGNRGEHLPVGPVVDVAEKDGSACFKIGEGDVKWPQRICVTDSDDTVGYRYLDRIGVDGVTLIVDGKPLPGHKFHQGFMMGPGMEITVLDIPSTYPGYVPEEFPSVAGIRA